MDMDSELNAKILLVPRKLKWSSEDNDSVKGLSWLNKYGFIAVNTLGEKTVYCDGMNEKGLSAANLYLKETSYPVPKQGDKIIDVMNIVGWILGNFQSVDEVKKALENTIIWGNIYKPWKIVCPLHIIVHDAKGKSLIIEWLDGTMKAYENENSFCVLTNSPPYEEQIKNAECSGESKNDITNSAKRFKLLYQMLIKFQSANPDYKNNLIPASEIIGRAISIRGEDKEEEGNYIYTQFVILRDHSNLKFYIRFCNELDFREIDLNKKEFLGESPTQL